MSENYAVTENVSYETRKCQVCEQDVAVDEVPESIIEETGYMVLIGEGSVSHSSESEGNWDEEFIFELDENSSRHPTVEAHIICKDCGREVHSFDQDDANFRGNIPGILESTDENIIEAQVGVVLLVGAFLMLLLLIMIL